MKIYKIREIQLGIFIAIATFLAIFLSNIDVTMGLTYGLSIVISCILLLSALLNLFIILNIPHQGYLKILYKYDDYFFNAHKILFFCIYFILFTIMVGLFAQACGNDRGQNILLISCIVSSIYYLIISIWYSYRFIYQSSVQENLDFDGVKEI